MTPSSLYRTVVGSLMGGASLLGVASPALATQVLFSSDPALSGTQIPADKPVVVDRGTTQVALDNGAIASFVGAAQFSVRGNGVVDLKNGAMTVVTPAGAPVEVSLPGHVSGVVSGANGAGSFAAGTGGGSRGSAISGQVRLGIGSDLKPYAPGAFWAAPAGQSPQRVVANAPTATPEGGTVRSMHGGGIAAAAVNGVPVVFGDALAATGASGDIVSAARRVQAFGQNPSLAAFPRADYATLTAYAAQAAAPYGGAAFNGAGADIVRTYFQYLATGASAGTFQSSYAKMLVSYLDLVRSGALPSGFTGATQAQLSAYIAFIGKTQGFGTLSSSNQTLLNAYLAFLQTGGTADKFASNASGLIGAYLDFVRTGGDPAQFTQASASIVSQYLAILQSSGIASQLTAQNQALLTAYGANGNSIAFANGEATALAAFVGYLNKGGLPSHYTALDPATLKTYLQTLSDTGLFDRLLGNQASFLRSYLTYLQTGATADQFSQLPINVLTQQAGALNAYYTYIQGGGTPSLYSSLTQTQIIAYLTALQNAGLFSQLLGSGSTPFLTDYLTYLQTGANPDIYGGLPNVDLNAYATQIGAFVAYLKAGNLPAGYTALSTDQVRAYLNALSSSGKLAALTGADATFLSAYLAYLQTGAAPNAYTGLPIVTYQGYATALATYYAYLAGGGKPSAYTALTQAQVLAYLQALNGAGQVGALLGSNARFYADYLTYLSGGSAPDGYASLPSVIFQNYATALTTYYAYLAGGGKPSAYTALTQAQVLAYLQALNGAGQSSALLGANASFYAGYLTYLAGGGTPDAYSGLPSTGTGTGTGTGNGTGTGTGAGTVAKLTTYTGGFPSTGKATAFTVSANRNGATANTGNYVTTQGSLTGVFLNAAGGYANDLRASFSPNLFKQSDIADIAGDDRAVVGRLVSGGTNPGQGPNAGVPYVALAPIVGALPLSGQIDYTVLSATRPIFASGYSTSGMFSGNLTLRFAATLAQMSYGFDGTITMNEAGVDKAYAFASAGRSSGKVLSISNGGIIATGLNTNNGRACATLCQITLTGGFAGSNPQERYGATYVLTDNSPTVTQHGTYDPILGSVVFAENGPLYQPVLTGPPPSGYGMYIVPELGAVACQGCGGIAYGSVVVDSAGVLQSWTDNASGGGGGLGNNRAVDSGGVGGVLGWTRYVSTAAAGGYGNVLFGVPTAALPTTGSISYVLVGSTTPSVATNGFSTSVAQFLGSANVVPSTSFGSGTIKSASLAINFGTKLVNFATVIGIGGTDFSLVGTGAAGGATLGLSLTSADGLGSYSGTAAGIVTGANADYVGLRYTFLPVPNSSVAISGIEAFGKDTSTPSAPTPSTIAPSGANMLFAGLNANTISPGYTITASTNGQLSALASADGIYHAERAAATDYEYGGLNGVIGWSRWAGGAPTGGSVIISDTSTTGGVAQIWGVAATNVPVTSGTVLYKVGGSATSGGSLQSASLGVDFGTRNVGFEGSVLSTAGQAYAFKSSGGATAPNIPIQQDMTFGAVLPFGNSTAAFNGFLAGPGASNVGLRYQIPGINGVIAFTKGP